ncbi:hypothetical protein [uncultured Zhongshania sp.]|jgi:hypothetical protein|uniref:hypothetical protein n=1 Tax=uncultured Zhongshania sp. TaxID=1642288 RepID=UPI0025D67561|nr:hypothetical protein [uncultured Zhongshania sp.]|tara:strand:- start:526 stop:741 length:216 start_codon:yes stop_codon:yes gene_type:complete
MPPTLLIVFVTAATITLFGCSKQTDEPATTKQEQTVLTSSQKNTLDQAKLMEKTLQNDMEMREQKMRDEGI